MTEGLRWPLSVPVLSDGVVTLRAHVPTDVDDLLEMCRDAEALRWTSIPLESTRETVEDYVFTVIPRGWDEQSHRGWAIEVEGRFAGNVDVRDTPIADIGFVLHPWARGRGLMVRAVRLATDWALVDGGVEIVHWRANIGNVDSLRVAHAAGFTLHGTTPGIVQQRELVVDAWTGSRRFGDPPVPRGRWAESTVIETERLRLRPFVDADVPRVVEACSDEITRHWLYGLPHPYVEATARGYLADCVWQAARGAKATWAVADRETDVLLGNVTVMDLHRGSGEVGYWTHPEERGRGVMTEAVRAVAEHAFDSSGLDRSRLVIYAAAGNPPSNAIAVAAGFRPFGTQTAAEPLGDGSFDDLNGYERLSSTSRPGNS
jgi:ribosomal-protein-alanine N-acetyltransferase